MLGARTEGRHWSPLWHPAPYIISTPFHTLIPTRSRHTFLFQELKTSATVGGSAPVTPPA